MCLSIDCNFECVSCQFRPDEASTDQMLSDMDTEYYRRMRREAQRERRGKEDNQERDSRRKTNSDGRRIARGLLSDEDRTYIRFANTSARASSRNNTDAGGLKNWWDRVALLNSCQTIAPLGLHWNRVCKNCGIKVCDPLLFSIPYSI